MGVNDFDIDPTKVNDVDPKHGDEKKQTILQINLWVEQAQEGSQDAMEHLLGQFNTLIIAVTRKYHENNQGLITWDELHCYVRSEFVKLTLEDYTVGGPAYYNVFIKRMLTFRTLYYIEQIIRNRSKYVTLSDDQMPEQCAPDGDDGIDTVVDRLSRQNIVNQCMDIVYQKFTERDCAIFCDYFFCGVDTYEKLSKKYDLSEPRISGIINSIKTYLRENVQEP